MFDWSSYLHGSGPKDGWRCSGHPGSRYSRAAVTIHVERRSETRFDFPEVVQWSVPAPWLSVIYAWAEVAALAAFVAATPEARSGLEDGHALACLVSAIDSGPVFERWPPEDHMMGDKLDVDLAIKRVFKSVGVRRFEGRPIRNEPSPGASELVERVNAELPAWVRPRVDAAQIEKQVTRFLEIRPWPFDCLIDNQ